MTKTDKQLLFLARTAHYTQWSEVYDMADQADSPGVQDEIRSIAKRLYHYQEENALN